MDNWNSFLDFIYFFRERGWKREEREGNINVWLPCTSAPTGDLALNPGMCPDWELNQRPFGSQASTQSTEPHQPGQEGGTLFFFFSITFP